MNFDWPLRHIVCVVCEFCMHKHPVRRDGDRRGLVQPDVAVDARAFVKPALGFGRIHPHGNGVLAAVSQRQQHNNQTCFEVQIVKGLYSEL